MNIFKWSLSVVLLTVITAVSLAPSLSNDFTDWDDHLYVVENPTIKDSSIDSIKEIFTRPLIANYHPVTMLSLWVQYYFSGLDPFPYHLVNLIIHLFNVLLVFAFIFLLSKSEKIAFIVALLFGIHPLHVESVAWISQRKDVLYAFFYLLALIFYIRRQTGSRKILFSTLCFIFFLLSCLSKPMAVTLPLILILIDMDLKKSFRFSMVFSKTHFVIGSILFGALTIMAQKESGAMEGYQISKELFLIAHVAMKGLVFYIQHTVFPVGLSAIYPMPLEVNVNEFIVNAMTLIVIVAGIFLLRRKFPVILFGSAFFLLTILPVLKFFPVGDAFAADRYHYVPSIGLFLICAFAADRIISSKFGKTLAGGAIAVAGFSLVIAWFGFLSYDRCFVWKNSYTIFEDMKTNYPDHNLAYNNLGLLHQDKGDSDTAIYYFKEALKRMELPGININLANEYMTMGRLKEAEEVYQKIIKSWPNEFGAYNGLAIIYSKQGNFKEALKYYKKALEIDPQDASIYNNIGFLFYRMGDLKNSTTYYLDALKLKGDYITAYRNLIISYEDTGAYRKAAEACRKLLNILSKTDNFGLIKEYEEKLKRLKRMI